MLQKFAWGIDKQTFLCNNVSVNERKTQTKSLLYEKRCTYEL